MTKNTRQDPIKIWQFKHVTNEFIVALKKLNADDNWVVFTEEPELEGKLFTFKGNASVGKEPKLFGEGRKQTYVVYIPMDVLTEVTDGSEA
jgi:hypothetical protein